MNWWVTSGIRGWGWRGALDSRFRGNDGLGEGMTVEGGMVRKGKLGFGRIGALCRRMQK